MIFDIIYNSLAADVRIISALYKLVRLKNERLLVYRRHVVCADEPFLFLAPSGSSRASVQPVPTHCTDNNVAVSLSSLSRCLITRDEALVDQEWHREQHPSIQRASLASTDPTCASVGTAAFFRSTRGTLHLGCRCRQNPPQRCYLLLRRRKRHLISNAVSPHLNTGWSFISLCLPSSAAVIAI